jgi:hypothetical protein
MDSLDNNIRSAKSGREWTANDLQAYNITIDAHYRMRLLSLANPTYQSPQSTPNYLPPFLLMKSEPNFMPPMKNATTESSDRAYKQVMSNSVSKDLIFYLRSVH